jgi:hypothetical protein
LESLSKLKAEIAPAVSDIVTRQSLALDYLEGNAGLAATLRIDMTSWAGDISTQQSAALRHLEDNLGLAVSLRTDLASWASDIAAQRSAALDRLEEFAALVTSLRGEMVTAVGAIVAQQSIALDQVKRDAEQLNEFRHHVTGMLGHMPQQFAERILGSTVLQGIHDSLGQLLTTLAKTAEQASLEQRQLLDDQTTTRAFMDGAREGLLFELKRIAESMAHVGQESEGRDGALRTWLDALQQDLTRCFNGVVGAIEASRRAMLASHEFIGERIARLDGPSNRFDELGATISAECGPLGELLELCDYQMQKIGEAISSLRLGQLEMRLAQDPSLHLDRTMEAPDHSAGA